MDNINSRINKVVELSGLTKSGFAKKINITPSHVSQMCSGLKVPSARTITDICREFGVREAWLRDGEEPMREPEPTKPTDELDKILDSYGLPREMRGLFLGYLELSDSAKKEVRDLITRWGANMNAPATLVGMTPAKKETREEQIEREAREEAEEYYRLRLAEKRQIAKGADTLDGTGRNSSNSGVNTA